MLAFNAYIQKLLFPKSKVVNKKAMLPETPPLRLGAQLGAQTPPKSVKLLFYMGKEWRG